jgi:hypothetical protein
MRNIIEESMQGRRVTRARLGHRGFSFVQDGRVGETGEIGEVVTAELNTRQDIRESEERRRLYENLSLHGEI